MQQFTGTQYLSIDIANCFGLDRLNWNDRLLWFHKHEPELEDLSPQAKHPIMYRKAVRAMRAVQKGQATNHIMGLDATASGLQIMASISGCHETARAVNLINTGKREDVYDAVCSHMNGIPGVKTDRDVVKKPVLTVFYGSTATPKEVFGDGPALTAFYSTLKTRLCGAYELLGIMQSYWNTKAEYHTWKLPDGHTARVPVTQVVDRTIEIDEWDHIRFVYRTEVIAPKEKSRSLPANITHSIDGWITRQMIQASKQQGYWMVPIHDCFFASPNHMNQIRENYVKILAWLADSGTFQRILCDIAGHPVKYYRKSSTLSREILKSEYALS